MTRMIFCRKLQKEAEGLAFAPFPGAVGQAIFETVSKDAWQLWLKEQTMIINENRLSVMDPQAQKFLAEQREKFLDNQDYERAKGWVPEKT
jgi:Fe-S cluster biosynthesis and repair protein YggX